MAGAGPERGLRDGSGGGGVVSVRLVWVVPCVAGALLTVRVCRKARTTLDTGLRTVAAAPSRPGCTPAPEVGKWRGEAMGAVLSGAAGQDGPSDLRRHHCPGADLTHTYQCRTVKASPAILLRCFVECM